MPRRTAAAVARQEEVEPEIPQRQLTDEEIAQLEKNELEKKSWWDMLDALSLQEKEVSKVYVYRLVWPDNANKPEEEDSNIDIIPAHLFGRDMLLAKHGGGKYLFWNKSKLAGGKYNFKRVVTIPGAPKIPRRYIIVQEDDGKETIQYEDRAPGQPQAGAAPQANVSEVLQQANAAARTANEAAAKALESGISLISTAASKSLEIVADSVKKNSRDDGGDSETKATLAAMKAQLDSLEASIKDQRIANLESEIKELKEQRSNPPSSAPSEVAAVAETARLFGVDGGFTGMVQRLAGGENKEQGFLESIGKGLGDGFRDMLKDWGGNLIQLGREYVHLRHVEAQQRTQPGAAPPPAPQPQHRAQTPALPQQPQAERQPTQEEFMSSVTREITKTIRYYMERNFNGAGVAEIVKDKFRDLMPFVSALDIFKDFNKLMEFCRNNEDLREFVALPEFAVFAREFWDEFQPEPGTPPESTAPATKPN